MPWYIHARRWVYARRVPIGEKLASVLVLIATGAAALLPAYIIQLHPAVAGGVLLLVGSVFAADGLLRCIIHRNKRTPWQFGFGILLMVLIALTTSEYLPIAVRLLNRSVVTRYIEELGVQINLDRLLRHYQYEPLRYNVPDSNDIYFPNKSGPSPPNLPNDSAVLLIACLLADLGVVFAEEK